MLIKGIQRTQPTSPDAVAASTHALHKEQTSLFNCLNLPEKLRFSKLSDCLSNTISSPQQWCSLLPCYHRSSVSPKKFLHCCISDVPSWGKELSFSGKFSTDAGAPSLRITTTFCRSSSTFPAHTRVHLCATLHSQLQAWLPLLMP